MAGRPAAGTTTSLLVGMCVAIGVAVIAVILLVVLWTKQEELRNAAATADANANRMVKSSEMQGALRTWMDQASGGQSVGKLMQEELTALCNLISADQVTPAPGTAKHVTENQLAAFWNKVEADGLLENPTEVLHRPLLDATRIFYDLYRSERERSDQRQQEIEQLQARAEELNKANGELQAAFDNKSAELVARLDEYEKELKEFQNRTDNAFTKIADEGQKRAQLHLEQSEGMTSQLTAMRQELEHKAAANRELQDRIREFQILPQPRQAARRTDGKVLLARGGEQSVFVDLGADDHLILGMRFAVYPPETGIPHSGIAKAAIEVINIGEEVSECRISWSKQLFPILEGDLIANPIYDRERQLSFLVLGEFDLDHDGLDDPNGKGTIEAVIREAGGLVTQELSPRIDFVIVGARPQVGVLSNNATEDERIIHDERIRALNEFNALVNEALSLSIPVLTQETFLDFLGRRN